MSKKMAMSESLISELQNSVQEMHMFESMQSNRVRNIYIVIEFHRKLRRATYFAICHGRHCDCGRGRKKERKKRECRNCVGNVYQSLSRRPIALGGQTT